jgi:hypothetical protein
MDLSEKCPVDGPPKGLWESLCHEEKQLFCKNRGKMAAIMRRPSDLVRVYSEGLTSVAQFVQRDEVNLRLCVLVCDFLPIGKLSFVKVKVKVKVKGLKCGFYSLLTFSALIWSKIQT